MKSVELNISKKNNTEKGEWKPSEIFSKLNFTGQEKEKGRKENGSELPYFISISISTSISISISIFKSSIFQFSIFNLCLQN